jgi:hypothetical protein
MSNTNEQIYSDVILTIGGKQLAGYTSFDYQLAVDMIETTNLTTTGAVKTYKAGRAGETISVEGIHDPNKGSTTYKDFWDIRALAVAGTSSSLVIYENDNSGGKKITLTGLVNNVSVKNQDNSAVNISCSFQVTGASTVASYT